MIALLNAILWSVAFYLLGHSDGRKQGIREMHFACDADRQGLVMEVRGA